ncbi:GIN domain-containing protein [Duganella sp. P38]|uniref:GIN domain-containing protein n=1 Tax=Duganella sp. P38 TaxID=3423949 RepID=UPI003D78E567
MRRTAVAVLIPVLCALSAAVQAADATRVLPSFIAINAKGAFALTVTVGKAQSVLVSGEPQFVSKLQTTVVDNELQIVLPDNAYKGTLKDPRITITLPALSRVKVEGAGETRLQQINSARLDISYLGAGRLAADGKVQYLRLNAKGVGEVDASQLVAERVDVNFEGVGNVSVHATSLLNAVARGIGGLTYYGHPQTVNKSVSGIGNVKAGD